MEPRIQYAKTSDGVSIAYASMGEGIPVVRLLSPGLAHVQRDWALAVVDFQRWTRSFRLISYDPRGSGLSDRDAIDFSMEAMVRDLQAVVDRTGLRSFALAATGGVVPVAVTYAAAFPDRVSHLILLNGWVKFSDYGESPGRVAVEALIDKDWTLFTETMGRVLAPSSDPRIVEAFGSHMRSCIEPAAYRAYLAAVKSYDVSALLSDVRARTLVLHNPRQHVFPAKGCQKLAAGIPDARFLAMDVSDWDRTAALVEEFVGGGEQVASGITGAPSAFRTVLFTDLVGHTEMMSRLGDERGRALLREHERLTREVLRAHGGTEVKTIGDGFMASFGSVTKAVECAVALQRAIGNWQSEIGERIEVRCGLNAGEPIEEEGDLFGATVILASRIAARAEGGEILVSDNVRSLCAGKGFLFSDRGEFVAKGFEEPVRVYAVRWSFDSPAERAAQDERKE